MMQIKIKYFDKDLPEIQPIQNGDWVDLRAAEDISMLPGEFKLIPLGVAMELPEGYEAIMAPRSSTFRKYHVIMTNSIGIVDESYKGDDDQWHFPAYALGTCFIAKGERICQFRIIEHQPKFEFKKVDFLGNENRGGIGSTGRM